MRGEAGHSIGEGMVEHHGIVQLVIGNVAAANIVAGVVAAGLSLILSYGAVSVLEAICGLEGAQLSQWLIVRLIQREASEFEDVAAQRRGDGGH